MDYSARFIVGVQERHVYYRDGSGPNIYTNAKPEEFCCSEMEDAWWEHAVGFGEFDDSYGRQKNINIYRCLPFPEGACWDEFSISFCPFCGSKIEIVLMDEPIIECQKARHHKPCSCGWKPQGES